MFEKDVQLLVRKADGSVTKLPYWMNVVSLKNRAVLPVMFEKNYPVVFVVSHIDAEGVHTLLACVSTGDIIAALPQFIENLDDIDGCCLSYYFEPSTEARKIVVEDICKEFDVPCHTL
ncbi:MAG: hypothetical protein IKM65_00885 [Bacteroidaceae bacterium]|nr:hypothetical protein [Bacteroidaceae bacterium]